MASTQRPLVLILHFADGSTSARPNESSGFSETRFQPTRPSRPVGCSILAPACDGTSPCVQPSPPAAAAYPPLLSLAPADREFHWALPAAKGTPAHGSPCWSLLRSLLVGEAGKCSTLVSPNAKNVLRTLAWLDAAAVGSGGTSWVHGGSHFTADGGPAADSCCQLVWRGLERWADPILMGWLLEPDSTEEALLLYS